MFSASLVCTPLTLITALTRSAYPGPDVEFDVWVSDATLDAVWQDSVLGGFIALTFQPKMSHKCSIGFKSGLWAGHGIVEKAF